MTAFTNDTSVRDMGREAPLLFGGWEVGLLVIMALALSRAGSISIPPSSDRRTRSFLCCATPRAMACMAVGMTFVIVNKELDLSVGSTFGLTATVFGMMFAPTYFDLDICDGRRSGASSWVWRSG